MPVHRRTTLLKPSTLGASILAGFLSAVVAGCAGSDTPQADGARPVSERQQACSRLLREMRLFCKDGLSDERGTARFDCLSRRLEFERICTR